MILYLGNALSAHGLSPSVMELLVPRLAREVNIISGSGRKNQWGRLLEMSWLIMKHRQKLSLVFIDAYSTRAFWYLVVTSSLCRRYEIPYIPVMHGGDLPQRIGNNKRTSAAIFKNAAINVCPSAYLANVCEQQGYPFCYIPNFLELEKYPFIKRERIKCRLLWVRSFHKIYNPELAIRVLDRLRKMNVDATLCMVGPDKDGSQSIVKGLAEQLDLSDRIILTGRLSKEEWISRSSHFDIFLNTTDFDNMPVSVIEAMALGLPVVSTNVGGMKYLIAQGEDGLLVEKGDLEGFVSQINNLLTQSGLAKRLSESARKKAETFAWEKVGPLWIDLIQRFQKPAT